MSFFFQLSSYSLNKCPIDSDQQLHEKRKTSEMQTAKTYLGYIANKKIAAPKELIILFFSNIHALQGPRLSYDTFMTALKPQAL